LGLEQLIIRCKKNDTKAQSELYKLFSSTLFSICLKYSRNYAEAQDNLQDAFITIFGKINQYKDKGSFEGWLKRITVNTALQRYRKDKMFQIVNEDHLEDTDVTIDDEDEENIPLQYLLECIQKLPNRYRLVFNLYVLDGYSHKEIGKLLEISDGTSKSNLARARALLKDLVLNYKSTLKSHSI
jgi:RNA polymerase sigma-70 factor (ECF subfamily)